MSLQAVTSDKAPSAIGPYSCAIKTGSTLYVSGQLPIDITTGTMPETAAAQAEQSLKNVKSLVESAGFSLSDVAKVVVFLTDINDFASVNEVYSKFFTAPYPARSCVGVQSLPKGAKVEIECIAIKG